MKRRSSTLFATDVTQARRFYHDLAAASGGALKVVVGGVENCGATYKVDRRSFPFPTIEYVLRGQGHLELADRHFDLGPGSVFAYTRNTAHRITCGAHGQLVKYFVAFTGGRSLQLLDSCGFVSGQVAQVIPADALTALFEELIWAGTRLGKDSESYCRRILECLALRIRTALAHGTEQPPASFQKYQDYRGFIEGNFLALRDTREIAERCNISEAHLCHLFQRYDHQTPYRYLIRLKMYHAAALIAQSDMLVRDAAEAVGFADSFHFSRVFRKVFGVPPSIWRHMNAAKADTE